MEFETYSVTVQCTENTVMLQTSSEIINMGAASFSQPHLMPLNYSYRGQWGIHIALTGAQENLILVGQCCSLSLNTLTSALQSGQGHFPDTSWANQKGLEFKGHTKSIFKIGFALVKKLDMGEFQHRVLCTWQLPWLAVECPWSALAGPLLTLLATTGIETTPTLQGHHFCYCRQFSVRMQPCSQALLEHKYVSKGEPVIFST